MYSKSSWGGAVDPFILVQFMKQDQSDALGSLIIYEYRDYSLIGIPDPGNLDSVSLQAAIRSPLIANVLPVGRR
jgi:hypothetical protein